MLLSNYKHFNEAWFPYRIFELYQFGEKNPYFQLSERKIPDKSRCRNYLSQCTAGIYDEALTRFASIITLNDHALCFFLSGKYFHVQRSCFAPNICANCLIFFPVTLKSWKCVQSLAIVQKWKSALWFRNMQLRTSTQNDTTHALHSLTEGKSEHVADLLSISQLRKFACLKVNCELTENCWEQKKKPAVGMSFEDVKKSMNKWSFGHKLEKNGWEKSSSFEVFQINVFVLQTCIRCEKNSRRKLQYVGLLLYLE